MISLIIKSNELNDEDDSDEEEDPAKYTGGTLIICPASLISQWSQEVEKRTKRGLLSYEMYHGPRREKKAKKWEIFQLCVFVVLWKVFQIFNYWSLFFEQTSQKMNSGKNSLQTAMNLCWELM